MKNKWNILKVVAIFIALIPILFTAFDLATTNKKTVIFLGHFHPVVAFAFEVYYLILIILGVIWLVFQVKSILRLRNEKMKNELLHLQSQVNPHFFFNMLNNLYGLIDVDSEKAKSLILKLSELMRYSIYEGDKNTVPLEDEVTYLKNYIELHKMRYHKQVGVKFDVELEESQYQVMPLLFIILVENAFKHGVENLRGGAYVNIGLSARKGEILFTIENNFDPSEQTQTAGIGLKNLKRRLKLMYPDKHSLIIEQSDSVYKAKLELEL